MAFISYLSKLLVLSLFFVVVSGEDTCRAELQTFVSCAKASPVEWHTVELDDSDNHIHAEIDSCFAAQSCGHPDFTTPLVTTSSSSEAQVHFDKVVSWWRSLDSSSRQCLLASVRGDFRTQLQNCVARGISNFSLPPGRTQLRLKEEERKLMDNLALHRTRLLAAERLCFGRENFLHACITQARRDFSQRQSCAVRKSCAHQVSSNCQDLWVSTIRSPICNCASTVNRSLRKPSGDGDIDKLIDPQIASRCQLVVPTEDLRAVRLDYVLTQRIGDFFNLYDDRTISICHACDGVTL